MGTFGNIQVGVVLVGKVGLEGVHGGGLVGVADGDELVGVAAAPTRHSDNLSKLGELGPNAVEGLGVQV